MKGRQKRSPMLRALAMLLAMSMLFTSSGFQVMAQEITAEQQADAAAEAARIAAKQQAAAQAEAARIAAEQQAAAEAAARAAAEQAAAEEAARIAAEQQAAAEAEAARIAAEQAAAEEAARIAAEQAAAEEAARIAAEQAAAEAAAKAAAEQAAQEAAAKAAAQEAAAAEEAAKAAAEQQAAEEKAAAEAAAKAAAEQAAKDAEAARQTQESVAAQENKNVQNVPGTQATETTESTSEESEPVEGGKLVLATEDASVQTESGAAKIKAEYGLGAGSEIEEVETKLYIKNADVTLTQFDENGKFVEPNSQRTFLLKEDAEGRYVEYKLQAGEHFKQEFHFVDETAEAGETVTFDVVFKTAGEVPEDKDIQETAGKVTYTAPEKTEETEETAESGETVVENVVTFTVADGALVTVEGVDATNATAMAKDGTIYFNIHVAEGFELGEVLVDGHIPARTTENAGEYIIENIKTDETIVSVATKAIETEAIETEAPQTEAIEIIETEAPVETEAETEIETEVETEVETEIETEVETEVETEIETEVETEVETEIGTEVETEAEIEVEYGTEFVYEDGSVIIKATASEEAKLPKDAKLVAVRMAEGSAFYNDAVATAESQLGSNDTAAYVCWDVYFEVNGERVEPDAGFVSVTMSFKEAVFEEYEVEEAADVSVIHVNEETGVAEYVTDGVSVSGGNVDQLGFTTDSFSPILLMLDGALDIEEYAAEEDPSLVSDQLNDFIHGATIVPDDGRGEDGNPTANNGSCKITLPFRENSAYGGEQFAKILYYNLPTGITVYKTEEGTIEGSGELAGSSLGTYEIKPPVSAGAPATLTIYFNDTIKDVAFEDYNNLSCTITFNSWFNIDISEDGEEKTFVVGDKEITLNFEDGKKWSGNKSASTYHKGIDGNPGYFEFTVEIMSDEPVPANSNIIFQDIMESNLSLMTRSVEVKGMASSGYTVYENKDSDNLTSINGFTVIVNQAIEAHTPIEIIYKAVIKDVDLVDGSGNVDSIGNKVWVDKGSNDEVTLTAEPTYKSGGMATKSNDGYNAETGKVKWTVTINPNGDRDMSGVTITDKLQDKNASYDTISSTAPQCNQIMPEDFTWENILSADRKSWSYKLPENAGYKPYIFTYETIMPSNSTDAAYQNNIYLNDDLITSDSVTIPGTGTGTGTGTGVEKTSKDEVIEKENGVDVRYVLWESKITIPAAGAKDVVYTDELTGAHVLEAEADFKANLKIKDQNGNTITPVSVTRNSDKKFTINFGDVAASANGLVYTISYRTKTTANGTIYNTGILYADGKFTSSPADHLVQDYSFAKSGMITDKNNGIITWRVDLNDGSFDLFGKNIIINDTFSDSLVYIVGSAKLYARGVQQSSDRLKVTGEEYVKDGVVIGLKSPITIEVGDLWGPYSYVLEYQTKLVTPMTIGQVSTYSNTATIKDNDITLGEPKASVTISNKILNKSIAKYANSENNYWVTYEVILNEDYQPFPDSATTFSIRDVMSENQELDFGSVVLQRQKQGESGWTDVPEDEFEKNMLVGNILEIDVTTTANNISRVAYRLEYRAHVSQTGEEDLEPYSNDITYTVAGNEHEDGSQGTADFGQSSSASGTGSLPFVKIKKAELGKATELLAGAEFALYREQNGSLVLVKDQLVTDSKGELIIGSGKTYNITLNTDTKYVLRETKAPAGYLKAEDVEFYLSGGSHPNGWNGEVYHFINDAKAAKVKATKTWEVPEGTVTPKVTFTLYSRYAGEGDDAYKAVAGAKQYVIESGDSATKTFTWDNLPYHEIVGEGTDATLKTIEYTVRETFETDGDKYSKQIGETVANTSGATVEYTIAVKNATTQHTVTKTWNDNNDALDNRPESITVELYRNNTKVQGQTKTLTPDQNGNWSYTWTGLPKYNSSGTAYTYTAKEKVLTHYDQQSSTPVENGTEIIGTTIVNKPKNEIVTYSVTKSWNDSNNQDGKRPENITLKLYYNGKAVDAAFITAYNGYSGNTNPIQYRYLTGTNTWSDWTPYTASGAEISGDVSAATWKCEWRNLPKFIEKDLVSYDAEEVTVPNGYTVDAAKAGSDGTIVNSHTPEKVSKTVKKYWSDTTNNDDGNRPTKVTVQLKQKYGTTSKVYESVELNAGNGWTYTWSNLPKYVRTNGTSYEATYTVEETAVPQYDTTYYNAATATGTAVNKDATTGTTVSIKNSYKPELISIEAQKSWVDNNNKDGIRPPSVELTLQKKIGTGAWTDVETKTISAPWDTTKAVWNNLLKYENKEVVTYKVVEKNVPEGYTENYSPSSITATNVTTGATGTVVVTNTHGAKAELQFTANKVITGNRGEAVKAGEFSFELRDGSGNVLQTKTTDANGDVTFNKITYTNTGKFTYKIKEVSGSVDGITYSNEEYTITVDVIMDTSGQLVATPTIKKGNSAVNGFDNVTFTNQYKATGKTSISISKKLVGKDMTAGEFTFGLFASPDANATPIKTVTNVAAANNKAATFTIETPEYTQNDIGTIKHYYLKEIADTTKADIYTYDSSVYVVEVTIEDGAAHNGNLNVQATIVGSNQNVASFVNNYVAQGGFTLTATKAIPERENIPSIFTFELYKLDSENAAVTGTPIQSKVNSGAGITFDTIEYQTSDIGKTYYYAVKEKAGTATGTYTYSDEIYRVKAVVSDAGEGDIEVETTYYKDGKTVENIIFTNHYKAEGSIDLAGKKNLAGTELKAGMFAFTLKKVENGSETTVETVSNAANGTITFETLTYDQDDIGTHTYKIYEEKTVNGAANDAYTFADPVVVTVTVAETDNNVLDVTADKNGVNEITFDNKYEASVEVELGAKKTLTGRTLADGQFEFTLTSTNDKDNAAQTKTNNAGGAVTFDKLCYDQDDVGQTYTYILKETDKGADGYTYDSKEYTVTVAIKDPNNNGTLEAEVKVDGEAYDKEDVPEFKNSYRATGKVVIEGTKVLRGKELEDGEFTFTLTGEGQNQSVTNKDGKVTFNAISYNQDQLGDHVYTVKETFETKDGYTFDQSEYQVTVTVRDNGDSTLTAEETKVLKVKDDKGVVIADPKPATLTFNNIYKSEGSAVLKATKVLNGQVLRSDMFTFVLKDENGTVLQEKKNSGTAITFDALTYDETKLGDHIYYIEEVNEDKAGYEYSTEVYKATVTVEENEDHNGKLVTSVKYEEKKDPDKTEAVFTNTYTAGGEITLEGTKTLTGNRKTALGAGEFSFVLTDAQGNIIETVTNDAEGKFVFSTLTYNAESVNNNEGKADFVYYVKEVIPENAATDPYDYSVGIEQYRVTVHVADNGNSTLDVTKTVEVKEDGKDYSTVEAGTIAFTNHYNAEGELSLSVQKETNIPLANLKDNVFSFRMAGSGVNNVVNSDPNTGIATFKTVEYDEDDIGATYFYTITEVRGRNAGYEYSNEVYLVRVDITDNGDGTLNVAVEITDTNSNVVNPSNLVFENKYAAEGEIVLEAHKTLNGRDLEAGKFTFTLTGEGEDQTVTNDANGKVVFDKITYNQNDIGKTYTYTVKETNDGLAGYTYSKDVYTVKVAVTDLGNGKLSAVPTITLQNASADTMEFVNTYAAEGQIELKAKKVLAEDLKVIELEAGDFSFALKDANGNVLETVQNDANGDVTFTAIEYTTTGEYVYTITEVAGTDGAVLYDDAVYTVKVLVTDVTDDGKLEVRISEIIKGKTSTDKVLFENDFTKVEISKQILGESELGELAGATLQIEDEEGNVVVGPWTSGEEAEYLEGVLKAGETYYLVETAAPAGYAIAEPVEFTVNTDGTVNKVTMYDKSVVNFAKVDEEDNALPNAKLEVRLATGDNNETIGDLAVDAEGTVLQWTSGNSAQTFYGLKTGTYYLIETEAPARYAVAKPIQFTVPFTGNETATVTMKDYLTKVKITKAFEGEAYTFEDGEAAVFNILEKDTETVVGTVTIDGDSTDATEYVYGLEVGTYVLREVSAPAGFKLAKDVEFTVTADMENETTVAVTEKTVVNKPIEVEIHKKDLLGENYVAGAEFVIYEADADGTMTETVATNAYGEKLTFTTGTDKEVLKAVKPGVYYLVETQAPEGFKKLADAVRFEVKEDLTVDAEPIPVSAVNELLKLQVLKVDELTGEALAGATLGIYKADADNKATETLASVWNAANESETLGTWETTAEAVTIEGLEANVVYVLKELDAPDAYKLADDIVFKLGEDGTVSVYNGTAFEALKDAEIQIVMTDAPVEMKIRKVDESTGEALIGAEFEVHKGTKDLYEEAIAENVYGEELKLTVTGEAETDVLKGLVAGNYVLVETAAPTGFVKLAEPIEFVVTDNMTADVELGDIENTSTEVKLIKLDALTGKVLPGAELKVVAVNEDGTLAEKPAVTFYGEELAWTTKDEAGKSFRGLAVGTYALVETEAPDGYTVAEPIIFTMNEDGTVTVDGKEVTAVEMTNEPANLTVIKIDAEGKLAGALIGAEFQLREANEVTEDSVEEPTTGSKDLYAEEAAVNVYGDQLVFRITGNTEKDTFRGILPGTYYLVETMAPKGFTIADPVKVVIEKNQPVADQQTITVKDTPTEVVVSKRDLTNEAEVIGAELMIVKVEDGVITEELAESVYNDQVMKWTSDGTDHVVKGLLVGDYALVETEAPDGYTIAEPIIFTVKDDGTVSYVATTPDVKKDAADDVTAFARRKPVVDPDATVSEIVTGGNKVVMKNDPVRVLITKAEFTKDNEVIPLNGACLEIREMVIENGEKRVGDIVSNIYGEKLRFVSKDHAIELKGIKNGTYYLVETDAPDGYVIADPVEITIEDDMKVGQKPEFVMEDCPTEVVISKVDITTADQELPGATLQILTKDADGNEVVATTIFYVDDETTPNEKLEWISGTEPKKISGLKDGTYILREVEAPAGYSIAEDIEFTISEDVDYTDEGKVIAEKVQMTNLPTETIISKRAMLGIQELPGAELQVLNADGEVAVTVYGEVLEWVSGEEEKVFKGLAAGTYTLHEVKSPDGYALAEDIEFSVGTDGVVKVGEVTEVIMRDDTTKVYISKMDVTNNAELPGAHLVLKDAEGNVVADWVTTGKPKQIIGELIAGATYTLTEVSAPAGYDLAKDIEFTVNADGTIQTIVMEDKVSDGKGSIAVQKLVMQNGKYIPVDYTFYVALFEDEACTKRISSVKPLFVNASFTTSTIFTNLQYGTYYVAETDEQGNAITSGFMIESNQVIDGKVTLTPSQATAKSTIINHVTGFREDYYNDGEITVNKTVLINGVKGNVNDTFYFALFMDPALTMMADAGVVSLELNNESQGSVVFEGIPYGTYYLAETDANGVPVDTTYEYTATVDSSYISLTAENKTAVRSVVNSKQVPVTPEYSSTTGTTASSVKTGDETPILAYLLAMLSAVTVFVGALLGRRRRRVTK